MRKQPTAAELEILRILWERGPSTVRDVCDQLNSAKATGYTTVLKLMQIMAEKQLVRRDEKQRAHIYAAAIPREQTQHQLVRDLVDRVFGGSASRMVMHALSSRKTSPEELNEIRRALDEMEGRTQ
jgi:predicted transcriptional regulator